MAFLLFFLKWLEWRFVIIDNAFEFYAGAIAIIFTTLGIWLAGKLTSKRSVPQVTAAFSFTVNQTEIRNRNITKREIEVLQLLASGMSNAEIAETLFVSQNTIKTHVSNLFVKLEAKRRTQAIDRAKILGLIQ